MAEPERTNHTCKTQVRSISSTELIRHPLPVFGQRSSISATEKPLHTVSISSRKRLRFIFHFFTPFAFVANEICIMRIGEYVRRHRQKFFQAQPMRQSSSYNS